MLLWRVFVWGLFLMVQIWLFVGFPSRIAILWPFVACICQLVILWLASFYEEQTTCKPTPDRPHIIVIGAGWSGILACKHALANGFRVTVLEKRSSLGGVWNFSEDPDIATVMKTTRTTSSSCVTEISDFPMTSEMGYFPHHSQILEYLERFVEKFELKEHIKFNSEVQSCEKINDHWTVKTNNSELISDFLLVCTGIHQEPDMSVAKSLFQKYTGTMYHSGQISEVDEKFGSDRILIFGGGETSSDIITQLVDVSEKEIIWAIPNGQWFQKSYAERVFGKLPFDLFSSQFMMMGGFPGQEKGRNSVSEMFGPGMVGTYTPDTYQGHGVPQWKSVAPNYHQFLNKSSDVLDFVHSKRVIPKRKIVSCEGKKVTFCDGSIHEFDSIILSTGFKFRFAFLQEPLRCKDVSEHYKFIFSVDDPTLGFIGFVRPVVTSLPAVSELQCIYAMKVFTGKRLLPSREELSAAVEMDKKYWADWFAKTSRRVKSLVEPGFYLVHLTGLSGDSLNFLDVFLKNPLLWFLALFGPYSSLLFRVQNAPFSSQWRLMKQMWRHHPIRIFVAAMVLLVLRVFHVHLLMNWLGKLKYECDIEGKQMSNRIALTLRFVGKWFSILFPRARRRNDVWGVANMPGYSKNKCC